jgi:hypothetical protein
MSQWNPFVQLIYAIKINFLKKSKRKWKEENNKQEEELLVKSLNVFFSP